MFLKNLSLKFMSKIIKNVALVDLFPSFQASTEEVSLTSKSLYKSSPSRVGLQGCLLKHGQIATLVVVKTTAFQQRTQLQSASSSAILFLFVPYQASAVFWMILGPKIKTYRNSKRMQKALLTHPLKSSCGTLYTTANQQTLGCNFQASEGAEPSSSLSASSFLDAAGRLRPCQMIASFCQDERLHPMKVSWKHQGQEWQSGRIHEEILCHTDFNPPNFSNQEIFRRLQLRLLMHRVKSMPRRFKPSPQIASPSAPAVSSYHHLGSDDRRQMPQRICGSLGANSDSQHTGETKWNKLP